MSLATIVLFVYNRPIHTQKTVESLQRNIFAKDSDLFIFADGEKVKNDENVKKVRDYIRTISGFKSITIFESKKNKGLAESIISGVSKVFEKYNKVIVLEDDLITSKYFLQYMNEALELFEDREDIFSISGYNYPKNLMEFPKNYSEDTFLSYRFGSWGWGTWKNRWETVDWEIKDFQHFLSDKKLQKQFNRGGDDMAKMLISQMEGKIDSWAIRFDYAHFKNNKFNLRPVNSLIENIGFDGSGVHCGVSKKFNLTLLDKSIILDKNISLNNKILKDFKKVFQENTILKIVKKIPMLEKLRRIVKNYSVIFNNKKNHIKWIGTKYGGFFIKEDLLPKNPLVLSFGIGEDISFDLNLIKRYGAKVYAFDPTPKSIKWVKSQGNIDNFYFFDYGLSDVDGKECFFLPKNRNHVSGSFKKTEHLSDSILVPMKKYESILKDLDITKIDVLKLDIEGAEFKVLEEILLNKIFPTQFLIEFHGRFFQDSTIEERALSQIEKSGFLLVAKTQHEFTFIKN